MWSLKLAVYFLALFVLTRSARLPLENNEGPEITEAGMVVIGDMIMPDPFQQNSTDFPIMTRKMVIDESYKWPEEEGVPTVPFAITNIRYYNEILLGIEHWEQHTCIRFRRVVASDDNYVSFIIGDGCWSYVGNLQMGRQEISIGDGCEWLGTVVHEIGHALGFIHEHMRIDRDDYLTINWNNIDSGQTNNFVVLGGTSTDIEFDYTSVMQYASTDFSSNGKVTMVTKDTKFQGLLGTGGVLSHRDKLSANSHYGCIEKWELSCNVSPEFVCENDGYLGEDCKCVCPPGTSGENCQDIISSYYDDKLPDCSRIIIEETTISTPSYPQTLPAGTWCVFDVVAPQGKVVQVTFDEFSLDQYTSSGVYKCATAFLEIRDTGSTDGSIYCGEELENCQCVSSGSNMTLYVDTPYSDKSAGFLATVRFLDADDAPDSLRCMAAGLSNSLALIIILGFLQLVF